MGLEATGGGAAGGPLARSHSLMDTLPLVTLRMLKPTVGIMSSVYTPGSRARGGQGGQVG